MGRSGADTHKLLPTSAARMVEVRKGKKKAPPVRATVAPEPRDIYWENLELDGSTYQFERRLLTQLITGLTILIGLGLSVAAKVVDAVYGDEMADQTDTWSQLKTFGVSILAAATVSVTNAVQHGQSGRLGRGATAGATTGSSACIWRRGAARRTRAERPITSDPTGHRLWPRAPPKSPVSPRPTMTLQAVLKKMIPNLAYREGYSTWAAYECAVFTKLAAAYVINTSVLPLLVGVLPLGITQAWHEEHGQKRAALVLQQERTPTRPMSLRVCRTMPMSLRATMPMSLRVCRPCNAGTRTAAS